MWQFWSQFVEVLVVEGQLPFGGKAASGSSRSSSEELRLFPWMSRFSVRVTPSPSAPWSTNFNANSWGTSNRSTGPVTMSLKC